MFWGAKDEAQWLLAIESNSCEGSRSEPSSCLAEPDSSPLKRMLGRDPITIHILPGLYLYLHDLLCDPVSLSSDPNLDICCPASSALTKHGLAIIAIKGCDVPMVS